MSPTELEHRLTSALAARAEQVTAADLRPPAPPVGPRAPRHRWMLATVTLAAAVLSVAVFVLIGQVRDAPIEPSHQPPVTAPATPEATEAPTPVASPTPAPETSSSTPIEATPDGRRSADTSDGVPRATEAAPNPTRSMPLPEESTKPPATRPADPVVVDPSTSATTATP